MIAAGKLVYDVGMNNGDDTAYYLHKGCRVVAIEANPNLIGPARARFSAELSAGRLEVVNVGVTADAGEAEFFLSMKNDVWGSFDRGIAGRGGGYETVRVPCRPFGDILEQFGMPYYLKIDIEGNDRLCLPALRPSARPDFLSIEMCHEAGDQDIGRLGELGYTRFQCVRQNDFRSLTPANIDSQVARRRAKARGGFAVRVARAWRRATRFARHARDGTWTFRPGSSGRFGPDLPDAWVSMEQMLVLWRRLRDVDEELADRGVGEWFDIHATS